MSEFRQIHMKIWKDAWFLELEPDHKLLFIYLFSNERTSISGIYELSKRIIAFETGLPPKKIISGLAEFERAGKAFYGDGILWIKSLRKFYDKGSKFVLMKFAADVKEIPPCNTLLDYCKWYNIPYPYPIDTLSEQPEYPIDTSSQSNVMKGNVMKGNVMKGNVTPLAATAADFAEILQTWKIEFPNKPQPRANNKTLQGKLKTRMKSEHFKANWKQSLIVAGQSQFLHNGDFFDLGWFLKNDDHYERCLNGNYKDRQSNNNTDEKLTPLQKIVRDLEAKTNVMD